MANIIYKPSLDISRMIELMREDSRYDVADNDQHCLPDLQLLSGNDAKSIKSAISARRQPPTASKVFLSNDCTFNCAYCGCRCSREDKTRYSHEPRALAEIAIKTAFRDKNGVFITSAIDKYADYTQERIIETLRILRQDIGYTGYIHAKVMPGTDEILIKDTGKYANRLSVNIEVAKSDNYKQIAKNKNKSNILTPMNSISRFIEEAKSSRSVFSPRYATSQTTQLMAGSGDEDDYTILNLSGALYKKYKLQRVYYTAYHYTNPAIGYETLEQKVTPAWRMYRLYQADRLMQLYGFTADDIAPDSDRFLHANLDPKAAWALRNLSMFPVEVNTADYETLLRIPGIGQTFAKRIIAARRRSNITFNTLKDLGIHLKRARHFITCKGKYSGVTFEDADLLRKLLSDEKDKRLSQMNMRI